MTDAARRAADAGGESKMEIRLLEKNQSKSRISLLVKGITPAYANSLRRVMINRVPVLAIEEVEFKKNKSAMYDEQVAHRMGLIPLETDAKSYKMKSQCKCEGKGCAQCELKLKLKAKGPATVYSSELKSQDPEVKPAFPNMPIVKLLKGQELELVAVAELNEGREHAKWVPGLIHYKYKPEIEVSNKCNQCGECVKSCPQKIFDLKNGKLTINQDNLLRCHLCDACVEACPERAVSVSFDKTKFVFYLESWGQLDCRKIARRGIERFNEILDDFGKEVSTALK
jgi:DNA-directed RNA polymerase subunit D